MRRKFVRARQLARRPSDPVRSIPHVHAKNACDKQATATELGTSLKMLYNKLHKFEEVHQVRVGYRAI